MSNLARPWSVVFFAGFVVYTAIRAVYARRVKHAPTTHRQVDALEKALLLLVIPPSLLLPLLYLFTPWLRFADYRLPASAPWIGLLVMLAALWLFRRSHADLGRYWSATLELREGHALVERGVYRRIRHPMYASIFLWCFAQGLLLPNWLAGWCALATFTVLYVVRTPREELMMCEFLGQEYRGYMSRTGRLIPRIQAAKMPVNVRPDA
jgi:protein-S-isoprenylcysteine O-methyltransferase Ste14